MQALHFFAAPATQMYGYLSFVLLPYFVHEIEYHHDVAPSVLSFAVSPSLD